MTEKLIELFEKITVKPTGTKRALLIGINYFGTSSQLSGCINDIDNMRNYLENIGYTEFLVMKDNREQTQNVGPLIPTRENIINAMKACVAKTKSGDTLYVHYSGHGSQTIDQNKDEADGMDECICPLDYQDGMLIDDDLNNLLIKPLPVGAKLRVCFDSCHSGSALDLPFRWVSSNRMVTENTAKFLCKDVIFISGCMDAQTSADSSFNGHAAGAMTWSLLTSLMDMKKSGKHRGTWTWVDLVQMMRMNLRKEQYDQIPQLGLADTHDTEKVVDLL
jgi:hypothetical protein